VIAENDNDDLTGAGGGCILAGLRTGAITLDEIGPGSRVESDTVLESHVLHCAGCCWCAPFRADGVSR
jgi:hypothetical protein